MVLTACGLWQAPTPRLLLLQGYHSGSLLVSLLGIFKAVVGILIRPTVGICEFMGKSAHGIGLLFLGREGISGAIQKRVRAPGTLADDSEEVCSELLLLFHCWAKRNLLFDPCRHSAMCCRLLWHAGSLLWPDLSPAQMHMT